VQIYFLKTRFFVLIISHAFLLKYFKKCLYYDVRLSFCFMQIAFRSKKTWLKNHFDIFSHRKSIYIICYISIIGYDMHITFLYNNIHSLKHCKCKNNWEKSMYKSVTHKENKTKHSIRASVQLLRSKPMPNTLNFPPMFFVPLAIHFKPIILETWPKHAKRIT